MTQQDLHIRNKKNVRSDIYINLQLRSSIYACAVSVRLPIHVNYDIPYALLVGFIVDSKSLHVKYMLQTQHKRTQPI